MATTSKRILIFIAALAGSALVCWAFGIEPARGPALGCAAICALLFAGRACACPNLK